MLFRIWLVSHSLYIFWFCLLFHQTDIVTIIYIHLECVLYFKPPLENYEAHLLVIREERLQIKLLVLPFTAVYSL
jgi:hypothetical protein